MTRPLVSVASALLFAACGQSTLNQSVWEAEEGDDTHGTLTLEGAALIGSLRNGVSEPVATEVQFARLGLIWEAQEASALEVRSSVDGARWTEWAVAELVHSEEGLHAGHVEAEAGAKFFQYRVPETAVAPSFVWFDPIDEVGPAISLPEVPEWEESDEDLLELDEQTGSLQQGLAASPKIQSRKSWGARAPRCRSGTTPTRVTVHHTVTPTSDSMSPQARLRAIQAFHMNSRGYCDIAYNFLVSRDGRVWRGRGRLTMGGHTSNANTGNMGISFIGTYTSTKATTTQICQAGRLLALLKRKHPGTISLNRTDVKGHRQFGGTACPGDALYKQLDAIIAKAKNGC